MAGAVFRLGDSYYVLIDFCSSANIISNIKIAWICVLRWKRGGVSPHPYFFAKNRGDQMRELMKKYNLTIKQISDRFEIPYRTVQNWANEGSNKRPCPSYVKKMMDELIQNDRAKD